MTDVEDARLSPEAIRHSNFVISSSFVIRHSSFQL